MPATSNQVLTFDDVLATTINEHKDTLTDNLYRSSAILNWLSKGGTKKQLEGGARIIEPLLVTAPTGFGSYAGTDTIPTTISDNDTAATYEWSQVGGTIGITGTQEIQNAGKYARIKLVKSRIMIGEKELKDKLNGMLLSDGTGNSSKDVNGLKNIVSTAAATVGNITETAQTAWVPVRTYAGTGAVTAFGSSLTAATGGFYAMTDTYSRCTDGTDHPDFCLMARECWLSYTITLGQNVRYVPEKGEKDIWAGWGAVSFMGMPCVVDLNPSMGTYAGDDAKIYMLNSKYINFYVNSQRNFVTEPFQKPINQDAMYAKMLVACQLTASNRRMHGVIEIKAV